MQTPRKDDLSVALILSLSKDEGVSKAQCR